ncbi:MAG: hypothetical protein PHS80_00635 [Methanothrix sp.]|nr:hypothetical protein [Methanothrix sp.]MDD4447809.1 hypothetical protein [Methanothrix sp.]
MKLCIVGIGGAGGKITKEFLGNEDLDSKLLSRITEAEYLSPGKIKGIWLEADKNDAKNVKPHFFGDMMEGCYPCYYIPHDAVDDGCAVHVAVREKYGYDVKRQGFVRDAQYLKAIFEIFDTDKEIQSLVDQTMKNESMGGTEANNGALSASNPIFDNAWNSIRDFTTLGEGECDGILFVVSFGGGTGTGFINPIINNIREMGKAEYPVFTLGILTEPGDYADKAQFSKSARRNLAAISAIYDLLTNGNGANGVIIVDNETLLERYGNDYISANKFIHEMMQPLVAARDYPEEVPPAQAVAHHALKGLSKPPIFVPLFASLPRSSNPEEGLIKKALSEEGRLFGCTPDKADFAFVFCRGFIDSDKIRAILSRETGIPPENIWPARKMGEGNNEILILLRNPYGGDANAYKKVGTLENRFCMVIAQALQYIKEHPEDLFYEGKQEEKDKKDDKPVEQVKLTALSKKALKTFFFGADGSSQTSGLVFELNKARKRIKDGEKPFFINPLRIFQKESIASDDLKKSQGPTKSDDEIASIVDAKIIEKLTEMGLIKRL